jgi:hypothetical protein
MKEWVRISVTPWGYYLMGYFWKLIRIFQEDEVLQRNGNILGHLLTKQYNYIFTEKDSFRAWFVVGVLGLQKCFDVDVYDFQTEL